VLQTLTPKEFAVLEALLTRRPAVVTRAELIEHCWDEHADPASNVVDVVVNQLRRKLGKPDVIFTARGAGYWAGEP
jgi:DNA-binding response OmpR family regulator